MKLELVKGGYEKIDAVVSEIETIAMEGIYTKTGTTQKFHDIAGSVKKLRQVFRDVILINPEKTAPKYPTEAA